MCTLHSQSIKYNYVLKTFSVKSSHGNEKICNVQEVHDVSDIEDGSSGSLLAKGNV
jgi:hypothetical protein